MNPFQEYFLGTLKNRYADFSGRASRSEYWYYILFSMLIMMPLIALIGYSLVTSTHTGELSMLSYITIGITALIWLAWLVPSIAINIRRLHDIGRSGWWYLIALIPFGSLVLFIFSVLESEPGRETNGDLIHGRQ